MIFQPFSAQIRDFDRKTGRYYSKIVRFQKNFLICNQGDKAQLLGGLRIESESMTKYSRPLNLSMELKSLFGALCASTYTVRSLRTLLSGLLIVRKGTAADVIFPKVRQSDSTSSKTRILIVYYLTSYPATTILSLTALTILLAVQKIAGIRTASLPLKWVELRFFLPQLSLRHLYHDFFFMYNVAAKKKSEEVCFM